MKRPSGLRALLIVLALVLVVPTGTALVLHDAIAEWVIVRIIRSQLPYDGEVNGVFDFTLSLEPTVTTTDVRLFDPESGNPVLEAGRFELAFDLRRALAGVPLITNVLLADARIILLETETVVEAFEPDPTRLVLPVVENAIFDNVVVARLETQDEPILTVDFLQLQEVEDQGQTLVDGIMIWERSGVKIEGKLGGPAAALDPTEPFLVDLTVDAPEFSFEVDGSIRHVVRGEDLDLNVRLQSTEVADLADLFEQEIPALGRLLVNISLQGDVADPRISAFDLTLGGGDGLLLAAAGSFEDPFSLHGLNATINSRITDRALITELLGDVDYEIVEAAASARVEANDDIVTVSDLAAAVDIAGGITVKAAGTAQGKGLLGLAQPESVDIDLSLTSPSTEAANAVLDLELPELGSVQASGKLVHADGTLAMRTLNVVAGLDGPLLVELSSDLPDILREEIFEDVVIAAKVSTEDSATLQRLFDFPVPGIGPLTLTLDAYPNFQDGEFIADRFDNIDAIVGTPDGVRLSATGSVGRVNLNERPAASGFDLALTASAKDMSDLEPLLEFKLPALGALQGSAQVSGDSETIILSNIVAGGDLDGGLSVNLQGRVGRIDLVDDIKYTDIDLDLAADAPDAEAWAKTLDISLPVDGPLAVRAKLTGNQDALNAREISATAGSGVPAVLSLEGQANNILDPMTIEASGKFQAVLLPLMTAFLGDDAIDLGTLEGSFAVTGGDDRLNIVKFDLDASSLEGLHLSGSGAVVDLDGDIQSELDVVLESESIAELAPGATDRALLKAPLRLDGRLTLAKDRTSFDGLTVIGESRIKTSVAGELREPRPRFQVAIASTRLNFADFERTQPTEANTEEQPPVPLTALGQLRLPYRLLDELDLDLKADFGPIVGKDFTLTGIDATYSLVDRRLAATTVAHYERGTLRVDLTVDASGETPTLLINATGDDMNVAAVLNELEWPAVLEGDLSLRVEVDTKGNTFGESIERLNGTAAMAIDRGSVQIGNLEMISSDRFSSKRAKLEGGDWTELRCAVIRLEIENGLATTNGLIIATPRVVIGGGGQIDVREGTIDVVLRPERRVSTRMGFRKPVRIHGPLEDPTVDANVAGHVGDMALTSGEVVGWLAAPFIFAPIRVASFLRPQLDDSDGPSPCLLDDGNGSSSDSAASSASN